MVTFGMPPHICPARSILEVVTAWRVSYIADFMLSKTGALQCQGTVSAR